MDVSITVWPLKTTNPGLVGLLKMAAAAILDFFQNSEMLRSGKVKITNMGHHAKFRGDRSNRRWDLAIFRSFQDGGRLPRWVYDAHVSTTCKGHLVVFITVLNLDGIDTVVSIIYKFCESGSKMPRSIHAPKIGEAAGSPSNTISPGRRPTSVPMAPWSIQPFGHNIPMLQVQVLAQVPVLKPMQVQVAVPEKCRPT